MQKNFWVNGAALLIVVTALISFSRSTHFSPSRLEGSDIRAIWEEGQRICDGKNPYSRIHSEGRTGIRKPPIYLPGFYLFECALDGLGVDSFSEFVPLWWKLNFVLLLGIAISYFLIFERIGAPLIGLSCMLLWLFGRWGMYGLYTLQTNFAAMLPLLWSLVLFPRYLRTSMLLFGLSLVMKQVAIFLAPLFLIGWYRSSGERSPIKNVCRGLWWIGVLPVAVSLPFFLWDPSGFLLSILYSADRTPAGGMPFVKTLGASSMPIMLMAMGLLYIASWRRSLTIVQASALTFLCFISLNGTFFRQYLLWLLLVIPLVVVEHLRNRPPER